MTTAEGANGTKARCGRCATFNCNVATKLVVFFFLRIRHPPRSPLFPSTTLSRSHRISQPLDGHAPQSPGDIKAAGCERKFEGATANSRRAGAGSSAPTLLEFSGKFLV